MHNYIDRVTNALSTVNIADLNNVLDELTQAIKRDRMIFIAGNGGSAAISSHFATDLLKVGYKNNLSIRALSLCDNNSLVTATSNDFGYEHSYSWQLSQLARDSDILITISSSGNSENVLNALKYAKSNNLRSISISGFSGGKSVDISDLNIVTRSQLNDYGPVEDAHSILCHYIAENIHNYFK